MRSLFRTALLLTVVALGLPTMAVAYPITVTISTVASGSLYSPMNAVRTFSNETVTIQAFFTTELSGCFICTLDRTEGFSEIDEFAGLTAAVTIAGLGTFEGTDNFVAGVVPGSLWVNYEEGHLGLNVESPTITATSFYTPFGPITGSISEPDLGPNCFQKTLGYCPVYILTKAGVLVLTSVADTATGEVQVGAATSVPEPGTLGLVGTGVLGVGGFLRRRLRGRQG